MGDDVFEEICECGFDCCVVMMIVVELDIDIVEMLFDVYFVKFVLELEVKEMVEELFVWLGFEFGVCEYFVFEFIEVVFDSCDVEEFCELEVFLDFCSCLEVVWVEYEVVI